MKAELVCDALQMALWQRRPKAGLVHHSDRGSQYASHKFRKLLTDNKMVGSRYHKEQEGGEYAFNILNNDFSEENYAEYK